MKRHKAFVEQYRQSQTPYCCATHSQSLVISDHLHQKTTARLPQGTECIPNSATLALILFDLSRRKSERQTDIETDKDKTETDR